MVNDNVRAAIVASGLKQKFVADRIGMSEQTFSAILTGQRKITVEEFFKLSDVLNMKPEALYDYPTEIKEV